MGRGVLPGVFAAFAIACADDSFGPTLTDRWGGEGAELDARQSPPTLQLICGVVVQFRAAIPLTPEGAFTVEADEASVASSGPPVTVSGQITGPILLLDVLPVAAPTGIQARHLLLHRGRAPDFPGVICAD